MKSIMPGMAVLVFAVSLVSVVSSAQASDGRQLFLIAGRNQGINVLVPDAASPADWQINAPRGEVVMFEVQDYTPERRLREQPRKIMLSYTDEIPVFAFEYGGELCIGDIVVPGRTVTLTDQKLTFDLTNFRKQRNTSNKCEQAYKGVRRWSGRIAMSANEDGDVTMDIYLDTYSDTGVLTYRRQLLNHVARNLNSPRNRAIAAREGDARERARRTETDAPIPEAVAVYGDSVASCFRRKKGEFFEKDFSRKKDLKVCVGRPKLSKRSYDERSRTVFAQYTCASTSTMSEYEFCAAAACVQVGQYWDYCNGTGRLFHALKGGVRSLEKVD
jgi:hypothetical protein